MSIVEYVNDFLRSENGTVARTRVRSGVCAGGEQASLRLRTSATRCVIVQSVPFMHEQDIRIALSVGKRIFSVCQSEDVSLAR